MRLHTGVQEKAEILNIFDKKGIILKVPESDTSNERIVIEVFTNTLTKEELKLIEDILL